MQKIFINIQSVVFILVNAIFVHILFAGAAQAYVSVEYLNSPKMEVIIRISGVIEKSDPLRLIEILDEVTNKGFRIKMRAIKINSKGGSSSAAQSLGEILRDRKLNTYIAPEAECSSACIYLHSGGLIRMAYGRVAVHRTRLSDEYTGDVTDEKIISLDYESNLYIKKMGLSHLLSEAIVSTPIWATREIDAAEKRRWGVHAVDRIYEELWFRNFANRKKITVSNALNFYLKNYQECDQKARNFIMTVHNCIENKI